MDHLSDELLLEAYQKAYELKLSPDFLSLIEEEIRKRRLTDRLEFLLRKHEYFHI